MFRKIVTEWTVNPFCSFKGDCWTEIFLVTDKTEESNERKGVMSETASVVVLAFIIVESLIIVFANIFTIYVFWKHRTRLRRNCLLPLNLAFADLLVGSLETIALGTSGIPRQFGKEALIKSETYINILRYFRLSSFFASIFFLVAISLERAYALICPLRHRVLSLKSYHWTAVVLWMAVVIIVVTLCLLSVYGLSGGASWTAIYASITFLSFAAICASCYVIRRGLSRRVPVLNTVHNRKNGTEQNAKLSKTLFIVIAASLVCWFPNVVAYSIFFPRFPHSFPKPILSLTKLLRLANSWVNPIIYCLKLSMFRQVLARMNPCKNCQRYGVRQS